MCNPTLNDSGLCIFQDYEFSAKKTSKAIKRSQSEIILKNGTNYAFIITSDDAGNSGFIRINWYEHETE